MNTNERELLMKDEVYAIVGAAMEVSNELGSGFMEAIYQEAMAIELQDRRIPFAVQAPIHISYKGKKLSKEYIPDFICYDQVIVEIKALKQLTPNEEAQLLNYLKATAMPVGLLLNFGSPKLEWKRMALTRPAIRVYSRPLADEPGKGSGNERKWNKNIDRPEPIGVPSWIIAASMCSPGSPAGKSRGGTPDGFCSVRNCRSLGI